MESLSYIIMGVWKLIKTLVKIIFFPITIIIWLFNKNKVV